MKNLLNHSSSILAGCGFILTSIPVVAGEIDASPSSVRSWSGWRLSSGPMVRSVESANFSVGSIAESADALTPFGAGFFNLPSSVGDENSNADRTYDDGYVNRDLVSPNDPNTPFWGYSNDSQYSGGFGGTMTMNVDASSTLAGSSHYVSGSSQGAKVNGSGRDESQFGFRVELDRMVQRQDGWSSGPVLGLSLFSGGSSVSGVSAFSSAVHADNYSVGVSDVYQLGAGVMPPSAPYSHNGAGPGALIPNQPDSRSTSEVLDSTSEAAFYNPTDLDLDFFVVSLDLGYRVERKWKRFSVNGAVGASLNIVPWDAEHSEQGFVSIDGGPMTRYESEKITNSGTDFLLGTYLQGGIAYDLTDTLSLGGFGRYDFTQSFDDSVGPSSFDQDLSGWTAGIVLTKKF